MTPMVSPFMIAGGLMSGRFIICSSFPGFAECGVDFGGGVCVGGDVVGDALSCLERGGDGADMSVADLQSQQVQSNVLECRHRFGEPLGGALAHEAQIVA